MLMVEVTELEESVPSLIVHETVLVLTGLAGSTRSRVGSSELDENWTVLSAAMKSAFDAFVPVSVREPLAASYVPPLMFAVLVKLKRSPVVSPPVI